MSTAATTHGPAAGEENPVKLEELLPRYLEEAGPSASVRTAVRCAWPKFLVFCERHGLVQVGEIRRQHVEDFFKGLLWQTNDLGQLYKANSVDQFVRRTRQVLRWAFCEGLVDPDPTHGLLLPRPVQPILKLLSWQQLQELLALPDQGNPIGLRDALVFQLLAETNLGIVGLVALTIDSVAELELEPTTQEVLTKYLNESRPALGGQGSGLFFCRDGKAMADHVVTIRLRQAAQQIGLSDGLPTRVLRKSYLAAMKKVHQRHSFLP